MFTISESLAAYLADCKANGFSAATVEQYQRIVSQFAQFCENKKQGPILPAAVAAYKAYLAQERSVKLSTVQYHLTVLRGFFAFCQRTLRVIEENPVLPDLDVGKKQLSAERRPYGDKLMTEHEIKALVSASHVKGAHEKTFLRNRAIVLLFVLSGLRNSELRALTPADLSFGPEGHVHVEMGKGGKWRDVPFPMAAQDAMKAYLASGIRPSGLADRDLLFGVGKTRDEWHEIDRFSMSTLVKRYVANATGHAGERSHALRHAFASTLLTNDVPMTSIQRYLGHSSVRTTEIYASHLAPKRAVQEANAVLNSLFS